VFCFVFSRYTKQQRNPKAVQLAHLEQATQTVRTVTEHTQCLTTEPLLAGTKRNKYTHAHISLHAFIHGYAFHCYSWSEGQKEELRFPAT